MNHGFMQAAWSEDAGGPFPDCASLRPVYGSAVVP